MKLYLAGPMTGYAQFNHPAFDEGARRLREAGYEVFSPADHDKELGLDVSNMTGTEVLHEVSKVSLRQVLGDDLAWITAHAEGIALLAGWEKSKGVAAEVATGIAIGIEHRLVEDWL